VCAAAASKKEPVVPLEQADVLGSSSTSGRQAGLDPDSSLDRRLANRASAALISTARDAKAADEEISIELDILESDRAMMDTLYARARSLFEQSAAQKREKAKAAAVKRAATRKANLEKREAALAEEERKKKEEEEAAKRQEEEEAAKKQREEEAARKRPEAEAAKKQEEAEEEAEEEEAEEARKRTEEAAEEEEEEEAGEAEGVGAAQPTTGEPSLLVCYVFIAFSNNIFSYLLYGLSI
jgi:hypothetical protein